MDTVVCEGHFQGGWGVIHKSKRETWDVLLQQMHFSCRVTCTEAEGQHIKEGSQYGSADRAFYRGAVWGAELLEASQLSPERYYWVPAYLPPP